MEKEKLNTMYMQGDGKENDRKKSPPQSPPPERKRDDYRDNEPRPLTESEPPPTIEPEKGWNRE